MCIRDNEEHRRKTLMASSHHYCNTYFRKPRGANIALFSCIYSCLLGNAAFRAIVRTKKKKKLYVLYPKQHIFRLKNESYVSRNGEFTHYFEQNSVYYSLFFFLLLSWSLYRYRN